MDIDYYEQDLVNGGYKRVEYPIERMVKDVPDRVQLSRRTFAEATHEFTWQLPGTYHSPLTVIKKEVRGAANLMRESTHARLVRYLRGGKMFGGLEKVSWVKGGLAGYCWPYIQVIWVATVRSLTNAGGPFYNWWDDSSQWVDPENSWWWHAFPQATKEEVKKNDGYPRDPVVRNMTRPEWVEKAMWENGFSRSNYKPAPVEVNPFLYPKLIGLGDARGSMRLTIQVNPVLKSAIEDFLRDY